MTVSMLKMTPSLAWMSKSWMTAAPWLDLTVTLSL